MRTCRSLNIVAAVTMAMVVPCMLGCSGGSDSPDSVGVREKLIERYGEPAHEYTVRGIVRKIPSGESAGMSDFMVQHEAIDDFVAKDGRIGMDAMTMPFPTPKELDLSAIHQGDVVEIRFAVWFEPVMSYWAWSVEKLPADTTLEFGPAKAPTDDGTG